MAIVNECIPYREPGARVTGTPTAPVTGKKFVAISGNLQADGTWSIAPPAAGGRVAGVATYDGAIGSKVPIIRGRGYVCPITSNAAIAAGAEVEVDATGAVGPKGAGVAVGYAVTACAGAAQDARISLY